MSKKKIKNAIKAAGLTLFATLFIGFFEPSLARAQGVDADTSLTAAQRADWLARVNKSLSSMADMSGRFEQKLPNGGHAAGDYLIDWPQNLRFAYQLNGESVVTVRGKFVAVQERPGGPPNWFPVSLTPLAMIRQAVAEGISDDMLVGLQIEDAIFAATLRDPSGAAPGQATLYFTRADNQLYAWRLVDAQNTVSLVRLRDITRHEALDKSLFAIVEDDENDDD